MAKRRNRRAAGGGVNQGLPEPLMPPVSTQPAAAVRKKRASGGHVEGDAARHHLGKKSRGGFSSARDTDGPEGTEPRELARGGGIHIKPSHRGMLHAEMGVAAGKPISTEKLDKAKSGAGPAEKKRIIFAENARKWNHG